MKYKKLPLLILGCLFVVAPLTSCNSKKETTPDNEETPTKEVFYTINFVNYDGSTLQSDQVKEGELPEYKGETPKKEKNAKFSYTFKGWDREIVKASANATYTALYSQSINSYTIKFVDYDGTTLQSESLQYGEMPEYKGSEPTRESTTQYTYTFNGWDEEVKEVIGNYIYTATYSTSTRLYQVTFDTNGGTQVAPQTVEYGQCAERPSDPTKDPSADTYYIFDNWDYDFLTPITGPTTISANWVEVSPSSHGSECVYIHYPTHSPTAESNGYKEFWYCPIHDEYVMDSVPEAYRIVEAGSAFDGTISSTDPRCIKYIYDENHEDLTMYSYGADMFSMRDNDFETSSVTYHENAYDCLLGYIDDQFYTFRIDLPRIDFTKYPTVEMDVLAPDWNVNNRIGPEADQLTYQTVYGGNKDQGHIKLSYKSSGLVMEFNSIEYASTLAFSRTFTDTDIINGLKSAYFYVQNKWNRVLKIQNIQISTYRAPESIYSYAGDTTKLSVVNGDVKLPDSADWNITNTYHYATNNTALVVDGNANPGALEVTLPLINFSQYTSQGEIRFKFGVKNNGEPMYFGAGASKVSLGTNSPTSESSNNNGYVNWEMIIRNNEAFVHNTYENHDYSISLTTGMRNGTERIVVSGGPTSIWRRYLFVDFYLYF